MPSELTFLTALLVGLLGSTHCIGMCGGIVGALDMGLKQPGRSSLSIFGFHLAYNIGRITSYIVIGTLAGYLGGRIASMDLLPGIPIARLITAAFMIALGLYLANWWRALSILERWGSKVWQRIQPYGQRLLPVRNLPQAFGLGLVWGWLPCGLVYTAVAWSLTTADPGQSALLMLGFGLGTMPAMLLLGGTLGRLSHWIRQPGMRIAAGVLVMTFGIYTGVSSLLPASGQHQNHSQHQAVTLSNIS